MDSGHVFFIWEELAVGAKSISRCCLLSHVPPQTEMWLPIYKTSVCVCASNTNKENGRDMLYVF